MPGDFGWQLGCDGRDGRLGGWQSGRVDPGQRGQVPGRGRLAGWRAAPAGGAGASSCAAAAGDDPDSDDGEDQRARAPGVQNFTTWVWTLLSSSVTVKV